MQLSVPQRNVPSVRRGVVFRLVSMVSITSMVIPLLFMDAFCSIYHAVYFRVNGIPLIPRKKYIIFDRGGLRRLSWVQRWNCFYCDYANGLIAWIQAVINTTEVYNCAIKNGSSVRNLDYQRDYFERDDFI